MTSSSGPRRGEFTGKHMWLVVIAFFGTIIAVNITMAVVSATSWTGLVVENSYVASQEFDDRRAAHQAQLDAGWTSRLSYAGATALLSVTDGTGQPVDLRRQSQGALCPAAVAPHRGAQAKWNTYSGNCDRDIHNDIRRFLESPVTGAIQRQYNAGPLGVTDGASRRAVSCAAARIAGGRHGIFASLQFPVKRNSNSVWSSP